MNFTTSDKYQEGNGDKRLYDDIIWLLKSKELGFFGGCYLTSGKEYVKDHASSFVCSSATPIYTL